MEKSNAVKNKFKFIAILVLVLAIVAGTIIGVYNYKNRKLPILAKIVDTDGKLIEQSVLLNAKKNNDGTYSLELPNVVNSFIVDSFYTKNEDRILFDGEETENVLIEEMEGDQSLTNENTNDTENINTNQGENDGTTENKGKYVNKTITLTLTEEELEEEEISLKAQYDKKIIDYNNTQNLQNHSTKNIGEDKKDKLKSIAIKKNEEANKANQSEVINYEIENSQNTAQYTLYNKRYVYDDKIAVTGYVLKNAEFKVEEIELTQEEKELTSAKKVEKKFKVSVNETENLQGQNSLTTGEIITVETINEENNILFYGNVDATEDKYIEAKKFGLISSDTEIYISETKTEEEKQGEKQEQQEGENDKNTPIKEIQIDATKVTGGTAAVSFSHSVGDLNNQLVVDGQDMSSESRLRVNVNTSTPDEIKSHNYNSWTYYPKLIYIWAPTGTTPDFSGATIVDLQRSTSSYWYKIVTTPNGVVGSYALWVKVRIYGDKFCWYLVSVDGQST